MSPNLYKSISRDGFTPTHESGIIDANLGRAYAVVYNAEIGNCLLKPVDIADMVEFHRMAAVIGASGSPANAQWRIRLVRESVERQETDFVGVDLVAFDFFVSCYCTGHYSDQTTAWLAESKHHEVLVSVL